MAPVLVLLWLTSPLPDYSSHDYTKWATALRRDLFSGYDKVVPPRSDRLSNHSRAGTDVGVQVRFIKVESVRPAEGRLRLKVWLRTWWVDQRLSWDPADYGNITTTLYLAEALNTPEESEIWLPDMQPYNTMEGTIRTLEPAAARGDSGSGK